MKLAEKIIEMSEAKIGKNTILREGDRFQGEVDGEIKKLRVLRPVDKYCQIVDMSKEGTVVGMLPKDDMLFGNIDWTKKPFAKIKDVAFN